MRLFQKKRMPRVLAALAPALGFLFLVTTAVAQELSPEFNRPGNTLIADQFNNRVIEVDPSGKVVWQFGRGPADFSPHSIIGVNDAQRVGPLTLMAGTSTPGGQPEAPDCTNPNGCLDNRVLLVNPAGLVRRHDRPGRGRLLDRWRPQLRRTDPSGIGSVGHPTARRR